MLSVTFSFSIDFLVEIYNIYEKKMSVLLKNYSEYFLKITQAFTSPKPKLAFAKI